MSEQTEHAEQPRQGGGRGIVGAVILIGLGIAFLLNNLGVFPVNWPALIRFWPVLLILVGLDVLLGRRSLIGRLVMAVLGIAIVIGVIYLASGATVLSDPVTHQISEPLGEVEELEITLKLGALAADISGLSDSSMAVSGEYTTDRRLELIVDYEASGDTGKLEISQEGAQNDVFFMPGGDNFSGELTLGLTEKVPIKLDVNAGAGDLNLDLTGLQLADLELNVGAGQVILKLPEGGSFDVSVGGGVGDIQVIIPDSLEARIDIDSAIAGRTVDSRFEKLDDGLWQSAGYDGADNQVDIEIDTAIGNVVVK
jgi:hypothetical protein